MNSRNETCSINEPTSQVETVINELLCFCQYNRNKNTNQLKSVLLDFYTKEEIFQTISDLEKLEKVTVKKESGVTKNSGLKGISEDRSAKETTESSDPEATTKTDEETIETTSAGDPNKTEGAKQLINELVDEIIEVVLNNELSLLGKPVKFVAENLSRIPNNKFVESFKQVNIVKSTSKKTPTESANSSVFYCDTEIPNSSADYEALDFITTENSQSGGSTNCLEAAGSQLNSGYLSKFANCIKRKYNSVTSRSRAFSDPVKNSQHFSSDLSDTKLKKSQSKRDKGNPIKRPGKHSLPNIRTGFKMANENKEISIKMGTLKLHKQGLMKKLTKECFFILYPRSENAKARLQQYSTSDSADKNKYSPELTILPSDVVLVDPLPGEDSKFMVQCLKEKLILGAENDNERSTWITALKEHLLKDSGSLPEKRFSFHGDYFQVQIHKETQECLGDHNSVYLTVNTDEISIITETGTYLATWPHSKIRSRGIHEEQKYFYVRTGKTAQHGEGTFKFYSQQFKAINDCIKQTRKSAPVHFSSAPSRSATPVPKKDPFLELATNKSSFIEDNVYEPVDVIRQSVIASSSPSQYGNPQDFEKVEFDSEQEQITQFPIAKNPKTIPHAENKKENKKKITEEEAQDLYSLPEKAKTNEPVKMKNRKSTGNIKSNKQSGNYETFPEENKVIGSNSVHSKPLNKRNSSANICNLYENMENQSKMVGINKELVQNKMILKPPTKPARQPETTKLT